MSEFDAGDALAATRGIAGDFRLLRPRMLALTEAEAVRVIADNIAAGVAAGEGFPPEAISGLGVQSDNGLLDPAPAGLAQRRRFRNSWRSGGSGEPPHVDMPSARLQRLGEVRQERDQRLKDSDVDLLRAQEAGNVPQQGALRAYRQQLRDLPTAVEVALAPLLTPEALDAWVPTWPIRP